MVRGSLGGERRALDKSTSAQIVCCLFLILFLATCIHTRAAKQPNSGIHS